MKFKETNEVFITKEVDGIELINIKHEGGVFRYPFHLAVKAAKSFSFEDDIEATELTQEDSVVEILKQFNKLHENTNNKGMVDRLIENYFKPTIIVNN